MRRFTDFFVMLAILVLNVIVSVLLWNTVEASADPNSLTLSYSVLRLSIVALPGVITATALALSRALWQLAPRVFYAAVFTAAIIATTLTWLMSLVFEGEGPISSLYLNDSIFALGVLSVAAIIGGILGLTGAVPSPAKQTGEPVKSSATASKTGSQEVAANGSKNASKQDSGQADSKPAPKSITKDADSKSSEATPGTSASAHPRKVSPDALDE